MNRMGVMRMRLFLLMLLAGASLFAIDFSPVLGHIDHFTYRVHVYENGYIFVRYPEFTFESANAALLNEKVESIVESMWRYWAKDIENNIREGFGDRTSYALDFQITLVTDRLVSMTFEDYAFLGGAHGNGFMCSLNFDIERGRMLQLKDLFVDGADYIAQINHLVRGYCQRVQTIAPVKSIKEDQDFYITRRGLIIFFQRYEYTPYAAGNPEVFIPFSSLRGLKDWVMKISR